MKNVILFVLILSSFALGKLDQEMTITFGYHSKESLSLRSYKSNKLQGYAIVKALEGSEVRFQKLSQKEYKVKESAFQSLIKDFQKHKTTAQSFCMEKIEVKTSSPKRAPASTLYCWDQAPKKTKTKFERFWKSNTLIK